MATENLLEPLIQISQYDEERPEEVADGLSGAIGAKLTIYLGQFVLENNLGNVFNADTDFVLPNIGKRRPDVAFCSFETLPEPPRSVVSVPPDLAVEVVSSRDEADDIDRKRREYQQANVKLIWIIRPVGEIIEVYKNDKAPELLNIDSILDGESVIPGFKLPVRKLFQVPKKTVIDSSTNSK